MENSNEINTDIFSSRNLNKRMTDIIPINKYSLNSYDFQKELLFFKNEILKDIHDIETKQNEKLINYIEEQTKTIKSYENKFLEQNQKISYLSNKIQDSFNKEKFEKYISEFEKKFEHTFEEMESKIIFLRSYIKDALETQEKNIHEFIFYPGKIGPKSQFRDFHAFIDYVLNNIKQLGAYQEILKIHETHKLKNNLEKELKTIQLQIKNNFNSLTRFTLEKINESEQKMINVLQDYNTQFVDVRLENNQNANKLQKKMNEISNDFEQIIRIRKDFTLKNEEQDKKFENIFQNIENSENKIIEQKKELNNIDTKFNLLTTYIDNQNFENINDYFSKNSSNLPNNKNNRIQSAKDFIDSHLKLISKGIIMNKDNSNNNRTLSETKDLNSEYNENYDFNNIKTFNINSLKHKKNFIMNKKLSFKGDSFIKKYINGKISIGEMYNHPSNVLYKNKNKDIYSNIFNLTKLQSNLESTKNNKHNVNNLKYSKNKIITKSLSDGNYNSRNSKLLEHENFLKEIISITDRKNKLNHFLSPFSSFHKFSHNRLNEQQLLREKKYGQKRKKLLIIQ